MNTPRSCQRQPRTDEPSFRHPQATAYDDLNDLFQDQLKRSAFFVPVAFHVHSPGSHDWGRHLGDKAANDRANFAGAAGATAFLDQLASYGVSAPPGM